MIQLANVFYTNWIKTSSKVLQISNFKTSFLTRLEQLGCEIANTSTLDTKEIYSAIVSIDKFQTLSKEEASLFLKKAKESLTEKGTLFIRVPESIDNFWSLEGLLDLLYLNPHFKIEETYTIGSTRDYLLKPIYKKPKIIIGMIAKNEERDLPRCLESLEGVAEGLVLVDTGSVDATMQVALDWIKKQKETNPDFFGFVEQYLEASEQDAKGDWKLWNFSKARNRYIKIIEKNTDAEYILWMDADDKLLNKEIRNLIFLDQFDIHSFLISSGNLKWPHHRLWKTHKNIHYKGWCHEYPNWRGPCKEHSQYEIYHDAAPGLGENSNDRNLRILQREMDAEPTSRVAFYLGNTYKDRGLNEQAIEPYEKRISYGVGYEDEYWFAHLYKARCERAASKYEQARKTLMTSISKKGEWAEFWMELAYLENQLGNYEKSIGWSLLAKDLPIPPTQLWREKDKYQDQPYRTISWSYQYLKNYEQALVWALLAKDKIGAKDKSWDDRIEILKSYTNPNKTVTWHRPGAIGDVLMTLNLVKLFKRKNQNTKVNYAVHPSVAEHLAPIMKAAGVDEIIDSTKAPLDSINLIGYPLHEGYPDKPMEQHLLYYFSKELGLDGEIDTLTLPLPEKQIKGKYITVHIQPGWSSYKGWDLFKWEELCKLLIKKGIRIVQIGGPTDPVLQNVTFQGLGKSLIENLNLMSHAVLHCGIDSWTNHATNILWEDANSSKRVPGVILWGSTQSEAAGYYHNKNVQLGLDCQPCFKEDPKLSKHPRGVCDNPPLQDYQNPKHACMAGISVDMVFDAILNKLEVDGNLDRIF